MWQWAGEGTTKHAGPSPWRSGIKGRFLNQTDPHPHPTVLSSRGAGQLPSNAVCTGGPWPRGLEAGGGLRQVRAGVGPRGGLGRVTGRERRGSLGPCPLPAGAQEAWGFLGGLGKVGPRWSLSENRWGFPGKLPHGCQAPRLSGLQPLRDLCPPPPPARPCRAMCRVRVSGSLAGVMTPDRGARVP